MALLLYIVGGAVVNTAVIGGDNLAFSMLRDHGAEEERKRHDLAEEQLQEARYKLNKDRMVRLYFINKKLREQNKARAYVNDTNEAILEYYQVFTKQVKPLPPEAQLSDFYHPSEAQINGELLFVAVGTGTATYALYKYLK